MIRSEPVERWRAAQKRDGLPFGVPVESGAACLIDLEACDSLVALQDNYELQGRLEEELDAKMFCVLEQSGLREVNAFACTIGPETYAAWIGSADGQDVELLIDLQGPDPVDLQLV